jgi:hypothetical protein
MVRGLCFSLIKKAQTIIENSDCRLTSGMVRVDNFYTMRSDYECQLSRPQLERP